MMVFALQLCVSAFGADLCSTVAIYEDRAECEQRVQQSTPPMSRAWFQCEWFLVHQRRTP